MLTALVLVCSVAVTPDLRDCSRNNAITVLRVPTEFGSPATCFTNTGGRSADQRGSHVIARTGGRRGLGGDPCLPACRQRVVIEHRCWRTVVIDQPHVGLRPGLSARLGRYVSDTRRSPGEAHARDVLGIIAPHAVGDGCIDQLIECIGQIDLAARDQRREPQRLGLEDTRAVAIHGSHNGALCGNQFGVGGWLRSERGAFDLCGSLGSRPVRLPHRTRHAINRSKACPPRVR
jgi:hypothetical protein